MEDSDTPDLYWIS